VAVTRKLGRLRKAIGSSPEAYMTSQGGRWETRRGSKQLFGVVFRLGRIDTLNRRDAGWMTER
jgi:hypothetical protein